MVGKGGRFALSRVSDARPGPARAFRQGRRNVGGWMGFHVGGFCAKRVCLNGKLRLDGKLLVAGSGYFFVDLYVFGCWFGPGVVLGHAVAH